MYKVLRRVRVAVALAVLLLSVWEAVAPAVAGGNLSLLRAAARWIASAQIVPALLAGSAAWLMFWTVVSLLFGRLYCSTVCPLGTLQDIVARVSHGRLRGLMEAYRYRPGRVAFRVMAVLVFVEALCLGAATVVTYMDPYADFERLVRVYTLANASALIGAAVIAAIVPVMAWRHGRMLCNTLCPVGAALSAASAVSLLRFDINPDLCTHCGRCERVCKSRCINSDRSTVDNARCVVCFDCVAACSDGAITWRAGRHRLQWPLLQSTRQESAAAPPTAISTPGAENNTRPLSYRKNQHK